MTNLQPKDTGVSVETLTSTLHTESQRARTDEERRMLHRLANDLANKIRQQDITNLNQGDFLRSSGINPEWGKLAA